MATFIFRFTKGNLEKWQGTQTQNRTLTSIFITFYQAPKWQASVVRTLDRSSERFAKKKEEGLYKAKTQYGEISNRLVKLERGVGAQVKQQKCGNEPVNHYQETGPPNWLNNPLQAAL